MIDSTQFRMGMFEALLDLFFPPKCASCKREGDFLCKNCIQEFHTKKLRSHSISPSSEDFECLDGIIYGADYSASPQLQAAIAQFKYRFSYVLADRFSGLTSDKLKELHMLRSRSVALVPVPLHKKRLSYRGFNQADLIARQTSERFGDRALVYPLLKRVRHTSQQARLGRRQRHLNLTDAFELAGDPVQIAGRVCFLVDDVCTTGATLDSCARVLKESGIPKVYGLVVARAFK